MNKKESPSKFSLGADQRSAVLQDRSGVVDHIFNDRLGREDLVYLSSDTTREPRPGTERLLGVLLEILFDGDDALFKESFGFGLTVLLPESGNQYPSHRVDGSLRTNHRRKDS